jgi:hypothetical protein
MVDHLRKLFIAMVAAIGFWVQSRGVKTSQGFDELFAPLRELFGPDASPTAKLFGFAMAALAAGAIIYRIWKASYGESLFQPRARGAPAAIRPARIARAMGRHSAQESPPLSEADKALLGNLVARAAAQLEHQERMAQVRGREAVSVRLVPQVPIRNESPHGWLGGGARLPAGLRWPEIGGAPLQLLAQVDCAALPAGLWDGLGPRHGWLAVFIEPVELTVQVMHFADVGLLTRGPALPPDNNIVGYDLRARPGQVGLIQAIPQWPVDVVAVFDGKDDPRREGWHKSSHARYEQRHDITVPPLMPFDWATARAMMEMAVAGVARAIPAAAAPHLEPEALAKVETAIAEVLAGGAAPDKILDQRVHLDELRAMARVRDHALQNGPAILQRLQALKVTVESMAAEATFSAAAIAPVLADMHAMTWPHKSVPPLYRDGRKLTSQERFDEGVKLVSLPLTTHDPVSHLWVHGFESYRRDRAKHAYARDPESLPAAMRADCEELWTDMAAHDMGSMGHVPWHYVDEFDHRHDVTLLELPSSSLMNWTFGDANSLVITMTKADLAAGAFDRTKKQVSN